MKNSRTKSYLLNIAESFVKLMQDIEQHEDTNYIKSVFMYALSTNEDLTKQKIIDIFRSISSKTEKITMSIAEALKIEGKIEGEIEGTEKTTIQFISGLLKIGMDADTIALTFDLPKPKVKEIILKINKG